ncbi:MAG: hypothetical protein HQK84_10470, partial [Nitrospinae bacterium]|nr:hypothetical protein [Nitrospinota bacterium]
MKKEERIETSKKLLKEKKYLKALDELLPLLYGAPVLFEVEKLKTEIYAALTAQIKTGKHTPNTQMRFGTSGWRGKLGEDFTYQNVAVVTEALCRVLSGRSDFISQENIEKNMGMGFDEIKKRGVVIGHDARYFGKEFSAVAISIIEKYGINALYIGQTSTPEISAAILQENAAFSINFTPSHNPWMYHGYKFNPPDGGPAGKEFTVPIQDEANKIFDDIGNVCLDYSDEIPLNVRVEDPVELYLKYLNKKASHLVNVEKLKENINNSRGFVFVADNVFGSSIGKFEKILSGVGKEKLNVLNAEREVFFKGRSVEPSAPYLSNLQEE